MNIELMQALSEISDVAFDSFLIAIKTDSMSKEDAIQYLYRKVHEKILDVKRDENLEKKWYDAAEKGAMI